MEQIRVTVRVPLAAAVAAGRSEYGQTSVVLDDIAVQSLTSGARALLREDGYAAGRSGGRGEALVVSEATVPATVAALEARATTIAAEVAAEAAHQRATVAEFAATLEHVLTYARTCPIQALRGASLWHLHDWHRDGKWAWGAPRTDESAACAVGREDELAAFLASEAASREASERALEAEKAAKAAKAAAIASEARRWAREYGRSLLGSPELQRAAGEDRNVLPRIRRLVALAAEHAIEHAIAGLQDARVVKTYATEDRDDVPSAEAYALLDTLTAARGSIAEASALPGAEVTIGPIERYDVAPRGDAVWRTGVRVTLSHPWFDDDDLEWAVLAEPFEQNDQDDE
jgi:hypothetical protein